MSKKSSNLIYWLVTGLVSLIFIGSASGKLFPNDEALKMAASFGLDAKTNTLLGIVEIISLILFVIPRTGILGTFLLVAYMGGAIATHLEHGQSIIAPCIIESFLFLVAFYRFPELRTKLLNA
ncbi:MAG: DoxX family protein [Bacteroidetes bacterium]|nr:DoxX family protein [Bacteroidota bacterium]